MRSTPPKGAPAKHAEGRAPQQARSVATRARLVEAVGATLVERGLHGASTTAVAEHAGVSQGALFKHFSTKTALVAAGVEHLLASFVQAFRAGVPSIAPRSAASLPERVSLAVRGLWQIFQQPEMLAVFQVYLAARTDPSLATALAPILDAHRQSILTEARRLFPAEAALDSAEFEGAVDAVVYAMQGVALGVFSTDERGTAREIALFERLALRELEGLTKRDRTNRRRRGSSEACPS
ncbi:MAG: TetR/AcrR family transcriptional regulator [Polyangiaceae bacterium]